jgi:multidrug efflux system membrane fusion protein
MLFKPELKNTDAAQLPAGQVAPRARRSFVSIGLTTLILGGIGYIGWTYYAQQQQAAATRGPRPNMSVSAPSAPSTMSRSARRLMASCSR